MTTTVPTDEETRRIRELATRGTALEPRLRGLEQAVAAARGRLDDALLDDVERTVDRAAGRLRLSAHHTVVAIAGATGSGKSSTFNVLTGLELSSTGVRRPTTSWATACVWGSEGAEEVLDWLGIPPRHQTMRDTVLDTRRDDHALDGVVLMDLPDHDSTEVSHHLEVDRLVELADLLVWVLDPQKYADAAIHDRYLAPYRTHAGVILVVLNHIDTVPPERRQAMVDDVKRLLALDGLGEVKVIPMSAREGIGVAELRREIAGRVEQKKSTTARVEADIASAAARLEQAGGAGAPREVPPARVRELEDEVAEAAGVPAVAEAVRRSLRSRTTRTTDWPPFALLSRSGSSSVPRGRVTVQRSVVDTEVRALADETTGDLGGSWADAVRRAATSRLEQVDDRLDERLGAVDVDADKVPAWARLVQALQWLLFLGALAAGGWWAWLGIRGTLDEAPEVAGLPLPAVLLGGGLVLGLVLAVVCRLLARSVARRRAAAVDDRLRRAVREVLDAEVVRPMGEELAAHASFRTGLDAALR